MRPLTSTAAVRMLALLALTVASAAGADEGPVVRRELAPHFAPDEAFLAQGGVQYFYDYFDKDEAAGQEREFPAFRGLDPAGRWEARRDPLYRVVARFVYDIHKDVSFFSAARVKDVAYMNRVCPSCNIREAPGGLYRVGQMPANTSRVRCFDRGQFQAVQSEPWAQQLLGLTRGMGTPDAVVLQENFDFERIVGMQTGEGSTTVTAHYALGPGRTRIAVHLVTLMHNIPPFFLGGTGRVKDITLEGALSLIRQLRRYGE
ncbi:MAG: hypothetical protein FJ086_00435 [Deltaproteobacteria bacterium]|nr:hypothetical protein [Deltaproteobacteria bacterium]